MHYPVLQDIAISNYEFTSSSESALLVLGFRLNSNANSYDEEGNEISFGDNGYFGIVNTASTDNGDIGVGLSSAGEGEGVGAWSGGV